MHKFLDPFELPPLSRHRYLTAHSPEVNGEKIEPVPYLTLPFLSTDISAYDITEGWRYSWHEQSIHGHKGHAGIDFAVPYGTQVVAPCDGYAISSYFSYPILKEGKPKLIDSRGVYFGLGYFVQIYNLEVNRYFQLGHLSDIDSQIPFSKPIYSRDKNSWDPINHNLLTADIIERRNPNIVYIERGQLLGNVGYSGLRWGYDEHQENADRPVHIDTREKISWDEPHLHTSDYQRKKNGLGIPFAHRDSYPNYLSYSRYPTPNYQGDTTFIGPEPLYFISEETGLPIFADEI